MLGGAPNSSRGYRQESLAGVLEREPTRTTMLEKGSIWKCSSNKGGPSASILGTSRFTSNPNNDLEFFRLYLLITGYFLANCRQLGLRARFKVIDAGPATQTTSLGCG